MLYGKFYTPGPFIRCNESKMFLFLECVRHDNGMPIKKHKKSGALFFFVCTYMKRAHHPRNAPLFTMHSDYFPALIDICKKHVIALSLPYLYHKISHLNGLVVAQFTACFYGRRKKTSSLLENYFSLFPNMAGRLRLHVQHSPTVKNKFRTIVL